MTDDEIRQLLDEARQLRAQANDRDEVAVAAALERTGGNVSRAAQILGMSQQLLDRRLSHGLRDLRPARKK
jgi:DNA-binding NtrC family response regulator